jgi:hypothetical protein
MSCPAWIPAPDTALAEFATGLIAALAECQPNVLDAIEAEMAAAAWTLNLSAKPAAAFCVWRDADGPRRVDFVHPNEAPLEPGRAFGIVRLTAVPFRSFAVAARVLAEGRAARAANSFSAALPGASENEKPLSSARTKAAKSSVAKHLDPSQANKATVRPIVCKPVICGEYPIFSGRRKRKKAGDQVANPSPKESDDDYASKTEPLGRRPRS